jgi:hypothetical protein
MTIGPVFQPAGSVIGRASLLVVVEPAEFQEARSAAPGVTATLPGPVIITGGAVRLFPTMRTTSPGTPLSGV